MSDVPTLPESSVRAIVRLLSDVTIAPGSVTVKKRLLATGLSEMIGADYWLWNVAKLVPGEIPVAISLLHNLSDKQIASITEANYKGLLQSLDQKFITRMDPGRHITRRGDQIVSREEFERSEGGRVYLEQLDFSYGYLFTAFPVPGQDHVFSIMGVWRRLGRPEFTPDESRIAHIVFQEVGWLHQLGVPEVEAESVAVLRPRLQTVLTLLVEGQSPREIGERLGISEHTVREYTKDVYAHFGVSKRVDLINRFASGDGGDLSDPAG